VKRSQTTEIDKEMKKLCTSLTPVILKMSFHFLVCHSKTKNTYSARKVFLKVTQTTNCIEKSLLEKKKIVNDFVGTTKVFLLRTQT
jgi:hypothetical protein